MSSGSGSYHATDVRVFGSVARGQSDDSSDVDLLVRFLREATLSHHAAMIRELEAPLGSKVGAWDRWTSKGLEVHAPTLLGYEAANVLHRCHRAGLLSSTARDIVLEAVFDLPIELEDDGEGLHRRAVALAAELGLPAAYDAHYLALARSLDAELWTADVRLARLVGEQDPRVRVLTDG